MNWTFIILQPGHIILKELDVTVFGTETLKAFQSDRAITKQKKTSPLTQLKDWKGGGPRVVVSTAAFHARVRGSVPGLGGLKETKLFLPHPRVKVSSVLGLRPPGLKFRILCLEDSVISIISPSSGGSPGPV